MLAEGSEDRPILSHWRRLAGMLFEPRRVMEDLARQPRWILPVVLGSVPSVVSTLAVESKALLSPSFDPWDYILFLSASSFALFVGQFVGQITFLFLVGWALVGLIRALGYSLSTRHARAIVSYSLVPEILLGLANRVFQSGVFLLELESPLPHWFWLNVSAFLDQSALHPLVFSTALQIGVVPLWCWLLVAVGLTIVVRSVTFRVALGTAMAALILVGSVWELAMRSVAGLFVPTLP